MTRVKRGVVSRAKHKKVLRLAKGYRMTRNRLVKVANEAVLHAGEYAFAGRRQRKRQMRTTWIVRMNAALRPMGISYSNFVHTLKEKHIELDRKILCKLTSEPEVFSSLVTNIFALRENGLK